MNEKRENSGLYVEGSTWGAMYRRWVYMAVAIVAAAVMPMKPVFSFQEDRGIIYVRSFSMDEKTFTVTQREMETGISHVTATMSVRGLYYCYVAMLIGSILSLLCFFNDGWRVWICTLTAIVAGIYYCMLVRYAIQISDDYYATLYPNYMALLPAVVLHMMILTRQSLIKEKADDSDEEE